MSLKDVGDARSSPLIEREGRAIFPLSIFPVSATPRRPPPTFFGDLRDLRGRERGNRDGSVNLERRATDKPGATTLDTFVIT